MNKDNLNSSFEEVAQKYILLKYGVFKPLKWFSEFIGIYFVELQIKKELKETGGRK